MNLGKIILKLRPPKNKSFIFSFICISYLYIFRCEFTTWSSYRSQKSIGKLSEQHTDDMETETQNLQGFLFQDMREGLMQKERERWEK